MQWDSLPREIQLLIVNYLDRDECKELRRTNKYNALLVAPKQYHTVHLTPNSRSFDRARGIASSSHLAQHVKAVVYHVGVLEDVYNGFQAFKDDIMRLHKPSGSYDDIMADILWKYHCFLEEIDGQRDFEHRVQADELRDVCQAFDSLESINTVLDEYEPFDLPEDFIGRRTGFHSACSADGEHFSNLFKAAAGKRLIKIDGKSMSWRCVRNVTSGAFDTVDMRNLKEMALGLFNSEFLDSEPDDQETDLKSLDLLLAASTNPGTSILELDFDEIPFSSGNSELQPISEVVFKHHWPALVHLSLQGFVSTEDDILKFLSNHSSTLRSLHLDDIEIADEVVYDVDGNETATSGSVLSLFKRISESLQLESASITGLFTNSLDEKWYVSTEHNSSKCLKHDIESWLSRKGPSPFPDDLLDGKGQQARKDLEKIIVLDGLANESETYALYYPASKFSDESWVWESELCDGSIF